MAASSKKPATHEKVHAEFVANVIGLSRGPEEPFFSREGIGKSCLCYRFVYPGVDDYVDDHLSIAALHEFEGYAINNDHFLYWGSIVKHFPVKSAKGMYAAIKLHIIEHTVIYQDETSLPFPNSERYHKRVLGSIESPGKLSYRSRNDIEALHDMQQYPSKLSKLPRGYMVVVDVSQEGSEFEAQLQRADELLEYLAKHKQKFIIVATKRDNGDVNSIRRAQDLKRKHHTLLIETSASGNINIRDAFRLLAHKVLKKSPEIIDSVPSFDVAHDHSLKARGNVKRVFQMFLSETVTDSSEQLHCIQDSREFQDCKKLTGIYDTGWLFATHILQLHNESYSSTENTVTREEFLEKFIKERSDLSTYSQHLKSWINFYIVEDDNDGVEELPGKERTGDNVSRSLSPSMSDDNSITVTITEVPSESELKERPVNTLEGDVEDAPHERVLICSTTNDNDYQSTDNSSSAAVKQVGSTRRKSPAKCSVDKERHIATNSESALVLDSDHNNLTYAEIELDHKYEDVDFDDKPGVKLQKLANRPLPPKPTVATGPAVSEKEQNLIKPTVHINNSRQHSPTRELPSINDDSRDCELQKRGPNSVNSADLYYEQVTLQEASTHEQAVPQVSNQAHATKKPTALRKVPVPVSTQHSTSEETPMHTESEDHGYENHTFDQSANPTSHAKHIPPRGQAGTQLNQSQDSKKPVVKKRMLPTPQPKPRPLVSKQGSLSTDSDSTGQEYENTAFKVANIPSKRAQKGDFSSLRRKPRVKTHELVKLQQQLPSISHPHTINLERRTDFSRLATPVTQRKQHERAHTPSPGHVMPLLHPLLSNLPLSATRSDGAINKHGSTHDHEYVDEDYINTALSALSGSQNIATCSGSGANIRADPEYVDEDYINTTLASLTSHTSFPDGHTATKGESYVNTPHLSSPTKAEAPVDDDDDLVYDYPDLRNKPFIFSASQHKALLSPKSPPPKNQFLKADSSTVSRKSGKLAKSNENITSAVKNEPNRAGFQRSLSSQEDSDYVNGYVNTELSRQLPSRKESSPKKSVKTKEDFDYDYADLRGPMKFSFISLKNNTRQLSRLPPRRGNIQRGLNFTSAQNSTTSQGNALHRQSYTAVPSSWLADGKAPSQTRDRFESYDNEGCSNPVQLLPPRNILRPNLRLKSLSESEKDHDSEKSDYYTVMITPVTLDDSYINWETIYNGSKQVSQFSPVEYNAITLPPRSGRRSSASKRIYSADDMEVLYMNRPPKLPPKEPPEGADRGKPAPDHSENKVQSPQKKPEIKPKPRSFSLNQQNGSTSQSRTQLESPTKAPETKPKVKPKPKLKPKPHIIPGPKPAIKPLSPRSETIAINSSKLPQSQLTPASTENGADPKCEATTGPPLMPRTIAPVNTSPHVPFASSLNLSSGTSSTS